MQQKCSKKQPGNCRELVTSVEGISLVSSSAPLPPRALFLRASYFSFYSFRCRCETTGGSLSYGVLAPSLSSSFLFLIVWRKVLSLNHRPPPSVVVVVVFLASLVDPSRRRRDTA